MPVEAIAPLTGTATMEITVSKFELLRELTATQGVVERKTTIPILSNYLFEASGDKLSLTATDLDLSLRTSCNVKVKKEGSCTIPARKLHDYVKLLPMPTSPSRCWRTTGSAFVAAVPTPKWSEWPARISPAYLYFQPLA